jgi:hypothetical protein
MPTLAILAACERVIIDRVGLPSLINIFQRMNVHPVPERIPENAVSPISWAIFVLWQHTEDELNKEFIQNVQVVTPDGRIFTSTQTSFKITEADDLQSKNHIVVLGLPVWSEGFMSVNVWLEGLETDKHSYLVAIKYLPKDQAQPQHSDALSPTA